MYILLISALLRFEQFECARPRSVNLALETVLEFDKDADMSLVDTVQHFLTKVKSTIEETRLNGLDNRRSGSLKFTNVFEQLIDALKAYNDVDLEFLLDAVETEISTLDYGKCKDESNDDLRKFLNNELFTIKSNPASDVRRNLNNILFKLKDEEYNSDSYLYDFLTSLHKQSSQDKFKNILNSFQLFRRRQVDSNVILRSIVKNGIGLVITDYYCQLNREKRREIKKIVQHFLNNEYKKSDLKIKKPKLKYKIKDRMKKITTEVNDKSRLKYIRGKNENIQEASFDIQKKYKKISKINPKESKREPLHSFYDKYNKKVIHSYEIQNDKSNHIIDNQIPKKKSKQLSRIRKNKTKTTKQSTVDDDYATRHEYKITESNEFNKKRKRFKIKDRTMSNLKRKKIKRKNNKLNLKLVTESTNTTESDVNINKQFLKKLMAKDDIESDSNSKSKDDLPLWVKYITKKNTPNKLKTFITLYPERIDIYYKASSITTQDRKLNTDGVRKRFKIKSSKDERDDNYNVITTHAEIDIDIDKSLLKPPSFYRSFSINKGYKLKNSTFEHKNKKHFKKSLKTKSTRDFVPYSESNIHSSLEKSRIRASYATYDSSSAEYFGSLYSHTREPRKKDPLKIKDYRKSNVKDELQTTATTENKDNVTNNNTDKIEIEMTATKDVDYKYYFESEENTTETFGTLAFWSGTERPTLITTPVNITENLTIINKTHTTPLPEKTNEMTLTQFNTSTTQIIFRSLVLNGSTDSRKSTYLNETNKVDKNETNSIINVIPVVIQTNTSQLQRIKNKTSERHRNVTTHVNIQGSTNIANVTQTLGLRRYLEKIEINDIEDGDKKKEIERKIRNDLEKLFRPITSRTVMHPTDPIDELEEVFNL